MKAKVNLSINILKKVYEYYGVNLHNVGTILGHELANKIHCWKKKLSSILHCNINEISFQVNVGFAINLINQLLENNQSKDSIVFQPRSNLLLNELMKKRLISKKIIFCFFLDLLSQSKQIDFLNCQLIWWTVPDKILNWKTELKHLQFIHNCNPHIKFVADLSYCSHLLKAKIYWPKWLDVLIFDPVWTTEIRGTCLVVIKKKYHKKLQPVVLGGGMNYSVCKQNFTGKPFPEGFEGGTKNIGKIACLLNYLKKFDKNK